MHSKAKIFNLALGALLLSRRIIDAEADTSNEAKVLQLNWDVAFSATLEDLDLDSTSTQANLALQIENPNNLWLYAYKYPSDCAFFRRIQSCNVSDNRESHIPKRVAMIGSQKVILTNEYAAIGEYISSDISIESLSATAGLCVALRLASMSAPLVTGKGARALIEGIDKKYVTTKAEAQELDRRENFNFVDPAVESEFVGARTS